MVKKSKVRNKRVPGAKVWNKTNTVTYKWIGDSPASSKKRGRR